MEVTQTVTHSQTLERNKFVEYLRQKKTDSIEVKKQWQDIVQNLTHERYPVFITHFLLYIIYDVTHWHTAKINSIFSNNTFFLVTSIINCSVFSILK